MKTLKYIAAIILLIVTTTRSHAQGARTAADQAKQLQVQLKLTDAQTTKMTTVLQQIDKEQTNDKTAQANMKTWQSTHNTKAMIDYVLKQMAVNVPRIEQILNPEQKKTFEAIVAQRRDGLKKFEASQK